MSPSTTPDDLDKLHDLIEANPLRGPAVGMDIPDNPWYWTEYTAPKLRAKLDKVLKGLGPLKPEQRTLDNLDDDLWEVRIDHRPGQTPMITVRLGNRFTACNLIQLIQAMCYWDTTLETAESTHV